MNTFYQRNYQATPSGKELRLGEVLQIICQEKVRPLERKRYFWEDLVHDSTSRQACYKKYDHGLPPARLKVSQFILAKMGYGVWISTLKLPWKVKRSDI